MSASAPATSNLPPLDSRVGSFLFPGDEFKLPSAAGSKLTLGPGLKLIPPYRVVACRAGVLRQLKGTTFFLEFKAKQYESFKKDDVVGVIKQKGRGDQYAVDVGTKERALLSKFAFEGATKRFRPDLQVGDVVYGKVVDLPPDFPMEITCVHSSGKAAGLGSLEGGLILQVPVHFTRVLRDPVEARNLLKQIGKVLPSEFVVGVNGMIWVKTKNSIYTILVAQLIQHLSTAEKSEYDTILNTFKKGMSNLTL